MKRFLSVCGLALALGSTNPPQPTLAGDAGMAEAGDIMIQEGWARASIGKAPNSAAYMTLMAHGDGIDKLIAVATPIAEKAELHNHIMEGGIARMRQVEAIDVTPGEPVVLEPGGLHVMLMGLKGGLDEGMTVPLTLTFEKAGDVRLEVPVLGLKGMKHGTDGAHGKH